MSIRSWWNKLWSDEQDRDEEEDVVKPEYFGSIILANGQPGTGKTYLLSRLAIKAAYEYRLPLIVQDTRGDTGIYLEKMAQTLEGKGDKVSKDKASFIRDRERVKVISVRESYIFLELVAYYQKMSLKSKIRTPKMYAFIDEGGVMRRDEESFWDIASGFRNAGITAFTSVHKDTDVSRVGRQCLRAVILQRPYEEKVNFFGVDVKAMDCSPPMSDRVTFIDSFERKVKVWDSKLNWEDTPEVLIHPVQPTNVKRMEF